MRTIRTKLYKFNELSEQAKKVALKAYEPFTDGIFEDAKETLNQFAEIFSVEVMEFDFLLSYRNYYSFHLNDDVSSLSGIRLATYIWNNYRNKLYKGEYYSLWSKTETSFEYHKNGYPVLKTRYSKIIMDNSCVLTGVCYDDYILQPIYEFLAKPTNIDFKDLLEECLSNFTKCVQDEYYSRFEDVQKVEEIIANEYEFTQDGKRF